MKAVLLEWMVRYGMFWIDWRHSTGDSERRHVDRHKRKRCIFAIVLTGEIAQEIEHVLELTILPLSECLIVTKGVLEREYHSVAVAIL